MGKNLNKYTAVSITLTNDERAQLFGTLAVRGCQLGPYGRLKVM
jgi:hypothetical protein